MYTVKKSVKLHIYFINLQFIYREAHKKVHVFFKKAFNDRTQQQKHKQCFPARYRASFLTSPRIARVYLLPCYNSRVLSLCRVETVDLQERHGPMTMSMSFGFSIRR